MISLIVQSVSISFAETDINGGGSFASVEISGYGHRAHLKTLMSYRTLFAYMNCIYLHLLIVSVISYCCCGIFLLTDATMGNVEGTDCRELDGCKTFTEGEPHVSLHCKFSSVYRLLTRKSCLLDPIISVNRISRM